MPLILAGVFIGAFFIACVGLVQFLAPDPKLPTMVYWLLGSFVGADPQKVAMIAVPTLSGRRVLMLLRWRLNLLSLGRSRREVARRRRACCAGRSSRWCR